MGSAVTVVVSGGAGRAKWPAPVYFFIICIVIAPKRCFFSWRLSLLSEHHRYFLVRMRVSKHNKVIVLGIG